jgi:hypothetical protein
MALSQPEVDYRIDSNQDLLAFICPPQGPRRLGSQYPITGSEACLEALVPISGIAAK